MAKAAAIAKTETIKPAAVKTTAASKSKTAVVKAPAKAPAKAAAAKATPVVRKTTAVRKSPAPKKLTAPEKAAEPLAPVVACIAPAHHEAEDPIKEPEAVSMSAPVSEQAEAAGRPIVGFHFEFASPLPFMLGALGWVSLNWLRLWQGTMTVTVDDGE